MGHLLGFLCVWWNGSEVSGNSYPASRNRRFVPESFRLGFVQFGRNLSCRLRRVFMEFLEQLLGNMRQRWWWQQSSCAYGADTTGRLGSLMPCSVRDWGV